MTQFEFTHNFTRLINTFGARAFPEERTKLIWKQICDMDTAWFSKLCDRIIGDMRQPPMVPDFREAAYKERQSRFNKEVDNTTREWTTEHQGLTNILASYGGAKTLMQAVEYERKVIREMEGIPDSAWPRVVNELSKLPATADEQRALSSMIKDLNEVIK